VLQILIVAVIIVSLVLGFKGFSKAGLPLTRSARPPADFGVIPLPDLRCQH
jgi:hypothetical protein